MPLIVQRILLLAALSCAAVAVVVLAGQSQRASADHVAGGLYLSEPTDGGDVLIAFLLSSDGRNVIYQDIAVAPTCGVLFMSELPGDGLPLSGHSFQSTDIDPVSRSTLAISARFSGGGIAQGQVQFQPGTAGVRGCPSDPVTLNWTARREPLEVVPNGSYTDGPNAVVVQGRVLVEGVTSKIVHDSARVLLVLWHLADQQWSYFLPANPALEGGLRAFPGPVASVFAILAD